MGRTSEPCAVSYHRQRPGWRVSGGKLEYARFIYIFRSAASGKFMAGILASVEWVCPPSLRKARRRITIHQSNRAYLFRDQNGFQTNPATNGWTRGLKDLSFPASFLFRTKEMHSLKMPRSQKLARAIRAFLFFHFGSGIKSQTSNQFA
jgi:hypothetical protein